MKKFILFFVLLFFVPHIYTQSTKIHTTDISDDNLDAILQHSFSLLHSDIGQSFKYANIALELSKKANNKKTEAGSYYMLGNIYLFRLNHIKALENLIKGKDIYIEIHDSIGISNSYNSIGGVYIDQNNFNEAYKNFEQSLNIYKKTNDLIGYSNSLNNMAKTLDGLNKPEDALILLLEALEIEKKIKNEEEVAVTITNIGCIYLNLLNYPQALKHFKQALKTHQNGENYYYTIANTLNISNVYLEQKEYQNALTYLKEAERLFNQVEAIEFTQSFYEQMTIVLYKLGDYHGSFNYQEKLIAFKDSIYSQEIAYQTEELEKKYETEKKDQQIALLEKEKQITDAETKRKNILIASSVGGFVLVMLMLFLFYNRQQLKKQNILQQAINSKQKELTSAVVKGQDEERKRIAKDLHDGLGTLLSTARINVNTLEDKIPAGNENKKLFDNALQIIDKLNNEVRHIAQNLMPETLNEFGLVATVEELIDAINRTGKLKITFKHYELSNELEKQLEINLYRIIQEIVNNTIKHSKATELSIELVQHEDSMVLLTEDNGIGFDSENQIQTGMGLKNIQVRLSVLNGTLNIDSSPNNNGTTISIEIPLLG